LKFVDEFAFEGAEFVLEEGDVESWQAVVDGVAEAFFAHFDWGSLVSVEAGLFGPQEPVDDFLQEVDLFLFDGDDAGRIPQEREGICFDDGGFFDEREEQFFGGLEPGDDGVGEGVPVVGVDTFCCEGDAQVFAAGFDGKRDMF